VSGPFGAGVPSAVTYEAQLAERVAELLPDADSAERLELLGVMDTDDMKTSLAFILSQYPQIFDFALVRDRKLVERLQERVDELEFDDDGLDPYCSTCGAGIGIFHGHVDGWHHFRGKGTVESPNELYDAGHEPALSWC
jgi:hypothetical protein